MILDKRHRVGVLAAVLLVVAGAGPTWSVAQEQVDMRLQLSDTVIDCEADTHQVTVSLVRGAVDPDVVITIDHGVIHLNDGRELPLVFNPNVLGPDVEVAVATAVAGVGKLGGYTVHFTADDGVEPSAGGLSVSLRPGSLPRDQLCLQLPVVDPVDDGTGSTQPPSTAPEPRSTAEPARPATPATARPDYTG